MKKIVGGILAIILSFVLLYFYSNIYCSGHSSGVSCSGVLGGFMEEIITLVLWFLIFAVLTCWIWIPGLMIFIVLCLKKSNSEKHILDMTISKIFLFLGSLVLVILFPLIGLPVLIVSCVVILKHGRDKTDTNTTKSEEKQDL